MAKSKAADPRSERFFTEAEPDKRSPFQKDRDRVLYAGAFARLAEITQVTSPDHGYVFHNRLTHSLKVGQIARRTAEKLIGDHSESVIAALGGLDADVAEAAGLAHDLGHPPFGHIAEEELDHLVKAEGVPDGFEGNAQSFRIVVRLAASDARSEEALPITGLNLTRTTLNGLLKYPWLFGHHPKPEYAKKWGAYRADEAVFTWVREGQAPGRRSLVAEIMDWADDITFAIHDLLDFFRAGRIPIDRCKAERSKERDRLIEGIFSRKHDWLRDRGDYEEALDSILDQFPFEPDEFYTDSADHRARLFDFSTSLIKYFIDALQLNTRPGDSGRLVKIQPHAHREVEVLKQFIWQYVIVNPDLALPQSGQRRAVRTVFQALLKAAKTDNHHFFPYYFHEQLRKAQDDAAKVRIVCDCVAAMTEKELLATYRCLCGTT